MDGMTNQDTRRARLRAMIDEEKPIDGIHDPDTEGAYEDGDPPAARYLACFSEGSGESTYRENPTFAMCDTLAEVAEVMVGQTGDGWLCNWIVDLDETDTDSGDERPKMVGYEYHARAFTDTAAGSTCPSPPAMIEVASVIEALRDAHRHDSAADAVEFVSELVGWCADDDPVMVAEGHAGYADGPDPDAQRDTVQDR